MPRFWLLLPLTLLLAAPAAATPELLLPAGAAGPVLTYGFAGPLGQSGLVVEATPTMLLVKAIRPGSPAALADVPAPGTDRVRLAAINGRPVEHLSRHELVGAFSPAMGAVALTFARKGADEPGERLVGPYRVALAAGALLEREAAWLLDQGRYDEAFKRLKAQPAAAAGVADKLLLAAQHLARTGDHGKAMALASHVPAGHPAHAEARRLYARIRLAYGNDVLDRADALAAGGQYPAALAALRGLPDEPAWRKLRHTRETAWRRALSEQASYRKTTTPARRR